MRLNHQRCQKNVLPGIQKKLTYFAGQFEHPGPCSDIITMSQLVRHYDKPISDASATSHWYVIKTNQFETLWRCTNWYLSETDQLDTSQRQFDRYLNKIDVFETS